MLAFDRGPSLGLDPVVAAAALAFGFVYAHPFSDGNGRIADYERVLATYSSRLLPCLDWEATSDYKLQVKNDTGDFYRFFDATPQAEFLYER